MLNLATRLLLFAGMLGLLSLQRVFFLMYHWKGFQELSPGAFARAAGLGLIIDSSTVAVLLLGLLPVELAFAAMSKRKALRGWLAAPVALVFSVLLLGNAVDLFYYQQFSSRLNALVLEYLHGALPVVSTATELFPLHIFAAVWLIPVGLLLVLLRRVYLSDSHALPPGLLPIARAGVLQTGVLLALSFLWVGEPFWRLPVFKEHFSKSLQLSMNSLYSFTQAVKVHRKIASSGLFFGSDAPSEEQDLKRILPKILTPRDELISGRSPFLRARPGGASQWVPPGGKPPHIVIVLMEGMTASFEKTLTPGFKESRPTRLSELAREGIFFNRIYAHEGRTQHGVVGTLSSLPSIFGGFLTRRTGTNSILTLGNLLKAQGYDARLAYGYDPDFDHKRFFLTQGGFSHVGGQDDFKSPRYIGQWGASDQDVFDEARRTLKERDTSGAGPALTVVLTGSNHAPYQIPPYFYQEHPELRWFGDQGNEATFRYADWCLGNFIDQARKESFFKNTVFVVLADHGEPIDPRDRVFKRFHIPLLVYAPELLRQHAGRVISKIGAQVDVAPTLLDLVDYPGPHPFMGKSLLDEKTPGFAVMRSQDALWWLSDQGVLKRNLRAAPGEALEQLYAPPVDGYLDPARKLEDPILKQELNEDLEAYARTVFRVFSQGRHGL
jgi:hypothetical protein